MLTAAFGNQRIFLIKMLNQVVQFFVGLVNDRCKTKYLLKCTFLLKGRFRVFLKLPAPSFSWQKILWEQFY